MAERGRVVNPHSHQRGTIVVTRPTPGGLGDTPTGGGDDFPDGPDPRVPNSSATRHLGSRAAQRTQTVQAAQGVVPTQFGGPLTVGGYIIAAVQTAGSLYVDFALGEPLTSISQPKFDGQTIQQLTPPGAGIIIRHEIHLGVAGDTTPTLMNPVIPGYTVPEYISHIVCQFRAPRANEPSYNPFNMTTVTEGMALPADFTGTLPYAYSRSPVNAVAEMLANARFSIGTPLTDLIASEWDVGAAYAASTATANGTARWEFAVRIDQRDLLENHIKFVLAHCLGHLRYDGGKIGFWIESSKSATIDNDGTPVVFSDYGASTNLASEVTWQSKGRDQVPTVVIVDFTNVDADDSVQYPLVLGAGIDWIERRFSLPGIRDEVTADRMAKTLWNLLQRDKDITLKPWRTGIIPLPGERVSIASPRIVQAGIFPALEDVIIVDQKVGENTVSLRAGLYRSADFDEPPIRPPGPRVFPQPSPGGLDLGADATPADHAPYVDPTGQTWVWLRQGAATITTIGQSLLMELSSSGLNRMSAYQIDAPAAPWTATAAFTFSLPQTATGTEKWWAGFFANDDFGASETGFVYGSLLSSAGTNLALTGTFAGGAFGTSGVAIPLPYSEIWLRVAYDGSAYTFQYSPDGYNWTPWSPSAVGGWIPAKIGFAVGNSSAAGGKTGARLLSWEVL